MGLTGELLLAIDPMISRYCDLAMLFAKQSSSLRQAQFLFMTLRESQHVVGMCHYPLQSNT